MAQRTGRMVAGGKSVSGGTAALIGRTSSGGFRTDVGVVRLRCGSHRHGRGSSRRAYGPRGDRTATVVGWRRAGASFDVQVSAVSPADHRGALTIHAWGSDVPRPETHRHRSCDRMYRGGLTLTTRASRLHRFAPGSCASRTR